MSIRTLALLLPLIIVGCSDALAPGEEEANGTDAITTVASFGSNPGNLAMYEYVPANMPAKAPLVLALHGCTQSATDYVNAGWNQLADSWKFYVVYAETNTSNNQNKCFNWFDQGDIARGKGEALSIKQMIDNMASRHDIDTSRVYVTGLSAGGAMTSVMLAAYPDMFSAGAVMSGLPYACASSTSEAYSCMSGVSKTPSAWGDLVRAAYPVKAANAPRVSIWQGDADYTVRPQNQDELVKQWTNVSGVDQTADATTTVDGATHVEYKDGQGQTRVETYRIPKMGHGTALKPGFNLANGCGTAGAYLLDAGICSTYYAGKFFHLDQNVPNPPPADAGAPPPQDAGAPPPADAGNPSPTCVDHYDTNYNYVLKGQATRCGVGGSYVCAVGSGTQFGLWNLMKSYLREPKAGYFEPGHCP
jgi:poly(hydroxyalkanoate) depolymerase family esterase